MIPIYCNALPGRCYAVKLVDRWFCEHCGKRVAVTW